ncbi:MAG: hypothetical protein NC206_07030 [Bacteroides sp.]|nr:hypothetical protein [Roseburia sp.]MCM1346825.1 hypothetical protein [Bacteroides sp.]MCM1421361.1 hypothetical protein [Bacteroides sp.]
MNDSVLSEMELLKVYGGIGGAEDKTVVPVDSITNLNDCVLNPKCIVNRNERDSLNHKNDTVVVINDADCVINGDSIPKYIKILNLKNKQK